MKKFLISVSLVCLSFMAIQPLCFAQNQQEVRPPWVHLYGGISLLNVSTEITTDLEEIGASTTFNFEDELKFPDHPSTFYIKTVLGSRTQFVFSIFSLKREGDNYITRNITFGDSVYEAGAFVHSYFNTVYYSGTFRFALLYQPNVSAGLSLGMRWMNMSAGMTATSHGSTISRDENIQAPAFLPGVYGNFQVIPSLYGRISAEYFRLNIGGMETKALEAQVSGEYFFLRNLGAGIAYSIVTYKADDLPENDLSIRDITYSLNGFSFFAALRF